MTYRRATSAQGTFNLNCRRGRDLRKPAGPTPGIAAPLGPDTGESRQGSAEVRSEPQGHLQK